MLVPRPTTRSGGKVLCAPPLTPPRDASRDLRLTPLTTVVGDRTPPNTRTRATMSQPEEFTCDVAGCSFSSSYKSALVRHTAAHDGLKPFTCPHKGCPYSSSQKSNVVAHQRTHTGEKPYECEHGDCTFETPCTSRALQRGALTPLALPRAPPQSRPRTAPRS